MMINREFVSGTSFRELQNDNTFFSKFKTKESGIKKQATYIVE
jgi:hypothetical protein